MVKVFSGGCLHLLIIVSFLLLCPVRLMKDMVIREVTVRVSRKNNCVHLQLYLKGALTLLHKFCIKLSQNFFVNYFIFVNYFHSADSGHGRPASSLEYSQLPFTAVTQFPSQMYQTSHTQSEYEILLSTNNTNNLQRYNSIGHGSRSEEPSPNSSFDDNDHVCDIIIFECVNASLLFKVSPGDCLHLWKTISCLLL